MLLLQDKHAEFCVPQVIAVGDALGADVRLAAAVNFKNLVKYRWVRTIAFKIGAELRCMG